MILPIILWGFIELPAIYTNKNILIAKTTQIFITMALLFVVHYSSLVLLKKKSPVLKGLAIYIASLVGSLTSYMILSIRTLININLIVTIVVLITYLIIYILLSLIPPKIFLFKDPNSNSYGKN